MQRKEVESKLFRSVGYDPATQTLEVEFLNGGVYAYEGVTTEDWQALATAESKGSHFSKEIRGKFAHRKIEEEPVIEVDGESSSPS